MNERFISTLLLVVVAGTACLSATDKTKAKKAAHRNPQFIVDAPEVLAFNTASNPIEPCEFRALGGANPLTCTIAPPTNTKIESISLHVALQNPAGRIHWKLRITDPSGAEWDVIDQDSPRAQLKEFWTEDVPGNRAVVELDAPTAPSGLRIVIDRYASPIEPSVPQAIWGEDQRESIKKVSEGIRQLGISVARLRIRKSTGQALCTGFLVSDSLLITNYHCIGSQAEALATRADFGFDDVGSEIKTFTGTRLELVNSVEAFDYVLIRLSGTPGKTFGHINLVSARIANLGLPHDLFLIEHAGGGPKQASIQDCQDVKSPIPGIDAQQKTDFAHHCDTLGGSSGSPVFDFETKELVGLHHLGFNPKKQTPTNQLSNQAVAIAYVLQDIKRQSTADYQEIVSANVGDPVANKTRSGHSP